MLLSTSSSTDPSTTTTSFTAAPSSTLAVPLAAAAAVLASLLPPLFLFFSIKLIGTVSAISRANTVIVFAIRRRYFARKCDCHDQYERVAQHVADVVDVRTLRRSSW
mmetsp:Transcript_6493/g.10897  ORF Transcript_6493/g.10897 Transcript_6493/m.10897 type:complete len:107 (+) Transcript_6493:358-678(+)